MYVIVHAYSSNNSSLKLCNVNFRCHCTIKTTHIKISNLLICFCRFDFSCPILEKDNFIENMYIGFDLV